MRHIVKSSPEPPELLRFRKTGGPNCTYNGFPDKDALRQRLLEDQGFLCCYCMQRIKKDKMRIEHYLSQSGHPEEQLVWRNLLGACQGGEGTGEETCDKHKGENSISIDPLNHEHMAQVRYLPGGKIQHGEGDTPFQDDIDGTLNLNIEKLRELRMGALTGFQEVLKKDFGTGKRWTDAKLRKKLADLRKGRPLVQFLGLLEYWIEKRIGR